MVDRSETYTGGISTGILDSGTARKGGRRTKEKDIVQRYLIEYCAVGEQCRGCCRFRGEGMADESTSRCNERSSGASADI